MSLHDKLKEIAARRDYSESEMRRMCDGGEPQAEAQLRGEWLAYKTSLTKIAEGIREARRKIDPLLLHARDNTEASNDHCGCDDCEIFDDILDHQILSQLPTNEQLDELLADKANGGGG